MENKMLTRATILLATFLFAIPLVPVNATSPASVSFTPSSPNADIGGTFVANVVISGASNLVAYDVSVNYNPDVLTSTGASLTGTLFDPATNNVLVARSENFPSVGLVRYAVVIIGGASVNPSASGSSLLNINFNVNDPSTTAATASEYPSSVSVTSQIVVLDNGNAVTIPSTNTGATYMPPANIGLRNVGCRAVNGGFNILSKGFNDGIFCRVSNTGTSSITAIGTFSWHSVGGVTGSTSSAPGALSAGQAGQLDAVLTVANANDIYIVTGTAARAIALRDGSFLTIPGQSSTFKIVVNTGF